jgi:hypothetical protein
MPHVYVHVGIEVRNGMRPPEAEQLVEGWLADDVVQERLPDGVTIAGVTGSAARHFVGDPPFNEPGAEPGDEAEAPQ